MRVRIRDYKTIKLPDVQPYVPKKGTASDDNIFTFDIETISLYNIEGNGSLLIITGIRSSTRCVINQPAAISGSLV